MNWILAVDGAWSLKYVPIIEGTKVIELIERMKK
jgi:hypothetical protein